MWRVHFPYVQTRTILNTSFPLSAGQCGTSTFTTALPVLYLAMVDPNHALPRTYEWRAAVEGSLGKADVVTVTYLGAAGRKLMQDPRKRLLLESMSYTAER
jgi:hypothetical protein